MFTFRRSLAAATGLTLLGGAVAWPGAPAMANGPAVAPENDHVAVSTASAWLASQLTDGLVHDDQYDFTDYGLSVDVGLALAEVEDAETAATISDALASDVTSYYTFDQSIFAGSLAKAAVFAEAVGAEAKNYGGHDLIAELEELIPDRGARAGRIGDVGEADYANTLGQSYAANALSAAGSAESEAVLEYLVLQQCRDGYFRETLGAGAKATCDAEGGGPSVDTTALAILNLQEQAEDGEVATVLDTAVSWLRSVQADDGSFSADGGTATPNANSTGLAGWALGVSGEDDAAESAATWLRERQIAAVECGSPLGGALGVVAYDDAALTQARADGLAIETLAQFRRATAQALPALAWSPEEAESAVEPDPTDVWVVVDYNELDSDSVRSVCVPDGGDKSAQELFEEAGIALRFTTGPTGQGFVCRVGGVPKTDACVNPAPADRFWSLWWSTGAPDSEWTFASLGVQGLTVPDGALVAFSWDEVDGEAPPSAPSTRPDAAVAGDSSMVESDSAAASSDDDGSGGLPGWVVPLVLVVLAVGGGAIAWARRRASV